MAPYHLSRRAQELTPVTYSLIGTLVSLAVVGLFCLGILLMVRKRKRTLQSRTRDLAKEQRQPFVAQQVHDERGAMGMGPNGPIELQSGIMSQEENKPQMLDGYAAPAHTGYPAKPVEIEAREVTK